jgi:hypothetical protein
MDTAAVGRPAQPGVELADGTVQSAVEILRASLGPDHRASRHDGDLDALAVLGLAWVSFVVELYVGPDELLVVPLDLAQLVGDVLPVVIGDFDVPALDDNVHS